MRFQVLHSAIQLYLALLDFYFFLVEQGDLCLQLRALAIVILRYFEELLVHFLYLVEAGGERAVERLPLVVVERAALGFEGDARFVGVLQFFLALRVHILREARTSSVLTLFLSGILEAWKSVDGSTGVCGNGDAIEIVERVFAVHWIYLCHYICIYYV